MAAIATGIRHVWSRSIVRRLAVLAMALSLLAIPLGNQAGTAEAGSGTGGHGDGIECEGKIYF